MTPYDLEMAILATDEVRVVIRAPLRTQLGDWGYTRKAANNTSVTEWLEQRIYPLLNGHEVVVIDGNGQNPHGRTRMSTLRDTYER